MSGRPGGTRGKRTRHEGSRSFDRRQTSSRYSNDPPPRFAGRQQRNGDGRGGGSYEGYYDDQPPSRSGSGGSGPGLYSPTKRERERDGWGGGRQQPSGGKGGYGTTSIHPLGSVSLTRALALGITGPTLMMG